MIFTPGESPAEALLLSWGQRNHSVAELFKHLYTMKHYQVDLYCLAFTFGDYSIRRCTHYLLAETKKVLSFEFRVLIRKTS
jgi:hypothetical protein